jgi:hypothetical protein
VAHRTVRCASGATATSAPTVACNSIQCATVCLEVRHAPEGAPDSLQDLSGAPPDCPVAQKTEAPTVRIQRLGDVAGAPDSVRWCTGLSGAPCDSSLHQTASLVVGAINTPNHPPFMASKFSDFPHLTRAIAFNTRHTKEIKSSPKSLDHSKSNSDLCSFELLRLDCFLFLVLSCDQLNCNRGKRHQLCGGPLRGLCVPFD